MPITTLLNQPELESRTKIEIGILETTLIKLLANMKTVDNCV